VGRDRRGGRDSARINLGEASEADFGLPTTSLKVRVASSSVVAAPCSLAASRKRLDCSGSSRLGSVFFQTQHPPLFNCAIFEEVELMAAAVLSG
jgi:hypothetical protein